MASLMVRDLTIAVKQHFDLARSFRAMASTWRQALDATPAHMLHVKTTREDGKVGAPTPSSDPFQVPLDGSFD